ncbi:MAG TPA: SCO family protein [Thermoanaerobaculia bacterium]|nr:SCO family protein [Thermoanaerobaculia bacterium]
MREPSRRNLLRLAALAPFAGGLLARSTAEAEVATKPSPREKIRNRNFPNVALRTQDGRTVRFYDDLVKDKVVTINFFYAQCEELCPLVTANLAKVQKALGDRMGRDIFMNSISLKPEHDSPEVLKHYAGMFDAQPGWTFLTGAPADIVLLRRSLGFTYPDPKVDQDVTQHIGNVRYGNEPLMLWSACPGMARAEWIAESVSWMIRPEAKVG